MRAAAASLSPKLASLEEELKRWKDLATNTRHSDYSRFTRHQSQINRLYDQFTGMIVELRKGTQGNLSLADVRRMDDKILQAHALWAYFRSKLLLRYSAGLDPWLEAADDLAWACFKAVANARERAGGKEFSKVPPLIYLGRETSPFVLPRDWNLSGQIPGVADTLFSVILSKSPLSLISMPFHQTAHLAETLVLAHEIGHVVEMDLGLSAALEAALEQAARNEAIPAGRLADWRRCRIEVFADLYGAISGRMGFCQALIGFLGGDKASIIAETIDPAREIAYPTTYLRVLLAIEALCQADGKPAPDALVLLDDWRKTFGEDHACKDYEDDLSLIVKALLDTPMDLLGHKSIRELAALNAASDARVKCCAEKLLSGQWPMLDDPRMLFAAATLAFDANPEAWSSKQIGQLVLGRIKELVDDAPRSAADVPKEMGEYDRKTGAELAYLL